MNKREGLSQHGHFTDKVCGVIFSRFCADVFYGRPLWVANQYLQLRFTLNKRTYYYNNFVLCRSVKHHCDKFSNTFYRYHINIVKLLTFSIPRQL